jgi:hypothetical protein
MENKDHTEAVKRWTITVEEDSESGDLILPFPEDFLKETGWREGDTLTWRDLGDGSWSLEKKDDKTDKQTVAIS